MNKKTGSLLALFAIPAFFATVGQTINPVNQASSTPPAPVAPLTPGLQPLEQQRPGQQPNEGEELLDASVEPMEPDDDIAEQDALSEIGRSRLRAGTDGPLSIVDGKEVEADDAKTWRIRPLFSTGVVYDDNIFISETDRQGDVIFTFTGGLSFELGDYRRLQENYLLAEYVATGFVYVDNPSQNAVNQSASLFGQYRFSKLAVQLESRYQYLTGAEREVGSFATRHIFKNALRGIYELSPKTNLDLEFFQRANFYQEYLNSQNYGVKFGGDYAWTGKVGVGAESVFGISVTDESPNQYYTQLRARATYNATGKLTFKTSAGIELRALEDGLRVSPVFSLRSEYRPFENTLIALEGYGDVQASASIANASYLATGVQLSVRQLFLNAITLGIAGGYENDNYFSNTNGGEEGRVDNYFFIRPSISYSFLKWFSSGVFYEFRQNESTESGSSFYNNRVGFELSATF